MCNLPASTVSNASSWTRHLTTGWIGVSKPCFASAPGLDARRRPGYGRIAGGQAGGTTRGMLLGAWFYQPRECQARIPYVVRYDWTGPRQRRTTMSVIKVTDMAYGKLRSPDLDAQEEFLTHFGMVRADRTKNALY